ncbi:uncharacterized protein LOC128244776 [Mya arenaria]|uniref:uncharacterized protein LOC128244776 n=1 Tax=Mya arenaria TaxID=6604 RepID=UPI0022E0C066|nr:uncharacterized protein LOC128244776 [Mya arenaria]
MPRNKGYRGDNEPGNGQPGKRQRNEGSNGREQEVFFTDGSHECITMQPMASNGHLQMQRSSFPQEPVSNGYQPHGFNSPRGNVPNGYHVPGPFAPQGNMPSGYCEPGHFAPHRNVYHGNGAPGHFSPQGNDNQGHGEPRHFVPQGNVPNGHGHTGGFAPHGHDIAGHYAPQGYGPPGRFAPNGNFNQGQYTAGHSAQQGHILPSMIFIVVKRILSVAVLIFNETVSWLKYFEWMGMIDLPDIIEKLGKSRQKLTGDVDCSSEAPELPTIYGAFCLIGTLYALFQIINTIGETVLEYHVRKTAKKYEDGEASQGGLPQNNAKTDPVPEAKDRKQQEKDNGCASFFHGFQLVHGWVETVAAMILGDFPQIIVIAFSSAYCTVDTNKIVYNVFCMFVKYIKNKARKESCKQKYKPSNDCSVCCTSCFRNCCCTWSCPLLCCCMVCYCRLCPMGDELCCEIKPICDCCCCCGPSICDGPCHVCGRQDEDPEWAAKLIKKLETFFTIGLVFFVTIGIINVYRSSSSENFLEIILNFFK